MSIAIPGLPEGVECVRIGIAGPDEFEFYSGKIIGGKREGSVSQIIVKPISGYEFARSSPEAQIFPVFYDLVRSINPPEVLKFDLEFKVSNSLEKKRVEEAFALLKELTGFVSLEVK